MDRFRPADDGSRFQTPDAAQEFRYGTTQELCGLPELLCVLQAKGLAAISQATPSSETGLKSV